MGRNGFPRCVLPEVPHGMFPCWSSGSLWPQSVGQIASDQIGRTLSGWPMELESGSESERGPQRMGAGALVRELPLCLPVAASC